MTPPTDIRARIAEHVLMLTWSPDHVVEMPFRYLRCHCGCAECVDERTGVRRLDPASVADDIVLQDMSLLGNYALKIRWSDGHDTGLDRPSTP